MFGHYYFILLISIYSYTHICINILKSQYQRSLLCSVTAFVLCRCLQNPASSATSLAAQDQRRRLRDHYWQPRSTHNPTRTMVAHPTRKPMMTRFTNLIKCLMTFGRLTPGGFFLAPALIGGRSRATSCGSRNAARPVSYSALRSSRCRQQRQRSCSISTAYLLKARLHSEYAPRHPSHGQARVYASFASRSV